MHKFLLSVELTLLIPMGITVRKISSDLVETRTDKFTERSSRYSLYLKVEPTMKLILIPSQEEDV